MLILSQDKDLLFTTGLVYVDEKRTEDGILFGYNIYGTNNTFTKGTNDVILGTFDIEEDALQVILEIFKLEKAGAKAYMIPECAMELEDLCD